MVLRCCVVGCKSASHDRQGNKLETGLTFHRFPTWRQTQGEQTSNITKSRRLAWIAAVRRPTITFDNVPGSMRVCSLHFHSGKPAYEMMECDPDWAPSLNLGHTEVKPLNAERFQRSKKRRLQASEMALAGQVNQPHPPALDNSGPGNEPQPPEAKMKNATLLNLGEPASERIQTNWMRALHPGHNPPRETEENTPRPAEGSMGETVKGGVGEICNNNMCLLRHAEINHLLEENRRMKRELDEYKMSDSDTFFRNDDAKVLYYTGLPSIAAFSHLLNSVIAFMPQRRALTHFQMLLLTLMRLRLNLPVGHIAYCFRVNRTTVIKAFQDTLAVLYAELGALVSWPDRERLVATTPQRFVKAFGEHVVVCIDCFEVLTEKPSCLVKRAEMFNSSKQHHTMKYMIGATPEGAISLVSKGWGGGTSDKQLAESSGLLENLLIGDIVTVQADRDFDIRESVEMKGAEVRSLTLTKGCHQLEKSEVISIRLHVMRVISSLTNKYKILTGTQPLNMVLPCADQDVGTMDKVVMVCCALLNMSASVTNQGATVQELND